MSNAKTIAIFGAGSGLGASLAKRFGGAGYRVALVARRAGPLEEQVAELAKLGIEAVPFPANLNDIDSLPHLVRSIAERFGGIDVCVYAPFAAEAAFVPAVDLDAAKLKGMVDLFTFAPVQLTHAVLPGMLARGDGAVVVVGGLSAVVPMAGMSGIGPLMAATRNYIFTLNAEVASKGVYAGTLNIGAVIERSTGMRVIKEAGLSMDHFPKVDPDELAEEVWTLVNKRDRVESIVPPLPHA